MEGDLLAITAGGPEWKRAWQRLDPAKRREIISRCRDGLPMTFPSDAALAAGLAVRPSAESIGAGWGLYPWTLSLMRRLQVSRSRRANLAVVRAHLAATDQA